LKYLFISTLTIANIEVQEVEVILGKSNVTGICDSGSYTQRYFLLNGLTLPVTDPSTVEKPSVSNMTEGRDRHLPSFWIPSKTPEAKDKTLKKPVS
jgi:hypothetical protein